MFLLCSFQGHGTMFFSKLLRRGRWFLAVALSTQAQAQAPAFAPDPEIQQIAEAYALDARDYAQRAFHITLDWSDASVEKVEVILDDLYRQKQVMKSPPKEEQVVTFAKMLGGYVGEVFRRNHGAEWGMVKLGGGSIPGLRATGTEHLFWPMGKVQKRLENGPEDNVWHYYQDLVGTPPEKRRR
jgi:uncharacterized protein DUF3806